MTNNDVSCTDMPIAPQLHIFEDDWALAASRAIRCAVEDAIRDFGVCTLMLTGGNTVQRIYQDWSHQKDFPHDKIVYFFGDERCVPLEHPDSNFRMACQSLFPKGIPGNVKILPMDAANEDRLASARRYEESLPRSVDVLLLGMGEDGHVASIFPGDPVTMEMERLVLPVIGPKPPPNRLTITPRVIADAGTVFLLATGVQKGNVLSQIIRDEGAVLELPVRCVKGATWLLDKAAGQILFKDFG